MSNIVTLDINTPSVQYLCQKDKRLAKLINMVGPITYSTHQGDEYAFLIHEIIEQMLSTKAAKKIYARLLELCDGEIIPEVVNDLSDDQIKSIGTSIQKVRYIRNLTNAVLEKKIELNLLRSLDDSEVIRELTKIRGIGNWTAKMYLIFVLDRKDVLPFEDGAFLQSYKWLYNTSDITKETILKTCKHWKPYSSIASRYMYIALDSGLTKV